MCIIYHHVFFMMPTTSKSLVDRLFDIPKESKSKNRDVQWPYSLRAFETPVLDVTQLSFWSKDVRKTCTNGDHLMECKLLLCCLSGISKTNKMSIVWLNPKSHKDCFISLLSAIHLESNIWIWDNDVRVSKLWWLNFALKVMIFFVKYNISIKYIHDQRPTNFLFKKINWNSKKNNFKSINWQLVINWQWINNFTSLCWYGMPQCTHTYIGSHLFLSEASLRLYLSSEMLNLISRTVYSWDHVFRMFWSCPKDFGIFTMVLV